MTAGSGILHQEMPRGDGRGRNHGFQLWANLPAAHKTTAPRYQDIPAAGIPAIVTPDGVRVKVICGTVDEVAVATAASPVRFLLVSGRPLGEPVAWGGPIVMNTREELTAAFAELRAGTFIRPAG